MLPCRVPGEQVLYHIFRRIEPIGLQPGNHRRDIQQTAPHGLLPAMPFIGKEQVSGDLLREQDGFTLACVESREGGIWK